MPHIYSYLSVCLDFDQLKKNQCFILLIGGNDALAYMQRLSTSVKDLGEGLIVMDDIKKEFEEV